MKPGVALCFSALLLLAGCSKHSAPELYKEAEETHRQAQRIADSLGKAANIDEIFSGVTAAYQKVFDEYPASAEAEQALFKVGEIEAGIMHRPEKALASFRMYAEAFPSTPKTETAMFMVGYIFNNDLNMVDSARAAYTRFLERFPEAELATSAQYELDNLGKKPEDLLLLEPGEPQGANQAKKQ